MSTSGNAKEDEEPRFPCGAFFKSDHLSDLIIGTLMATLPEV